MRAGVVLKWTLCGAGRVGSGLQMWHADIHCVTSYNFIEADLRSIVRAADSLGVCARAQPACVLRSAAATYLRPATATARM